MKKLIALLLAVIMISSSVLACAEAVPPIPSMTITDTVKFNREAIRDILTNIGMRKDKIEVIDSALAVIEVSSQNVTIADDGIEYDMKLGDKTIFALAGETAPDGVFIGSNLFPSYTLTMTYETFENLMAQFTASEKIEAYDNSVYGEYYAVGEEAKRESEFIALVREYYKTLTEMLVSSVVVGEPEYGSYTVDGITYNAMLPVTLDTRAFVDKVLNMVNQFIHSGPVTMAQFVLKSFGIDIPLEVPVIKDVPALKMTFYRCQDDAGNVNGPECTVVEVSEMDGVTPFIDVWIRREGENVRIKYVMPSRELTVEAEQVWADDGGFIRLDVHAAKLYYGISLVETLGDEIHIIFNIFYLDPVTPLMSNDIAIFQGGLRELTVRSWRKGVLSIEKMLNGETDTGILVGLLMDIVLNGVGETIDVVEKSVPEVQRLFEHMSSEKK